MKTTFPAVSVQFRVLALCLTLLLVGGNAPNAQPKTAPSTVKSEQESMAITRLQQTIANLLDEPKFRNSFIGIEVRSVKTGESLFHQNENKNFLPASNLKLVTTAAALGILGPDFHYSTQLVTNGEIKRGTLKGDLIIKGSGDPTFGSPSMYPEKDPTYIFEQWADTLEKLGIEKIDGSIIADPSCFTDDPFPDGWAVEDLPYYFATSSSGLAFADNAVSVSVTPGLRSGSKALSELTPETEYLSVNNNATTHEPAQITKAQGKDSSVALTYQPMNTIKVTREQGENSITIAGTIDRGAAGVHEQLSVENPPLYAATLLREMLEYRGFTITGGTTLASELDAKIDYSETDRLCSYESPPLSEIVRVINKRSQNFYSEQVLRTLGRVSFGKASWESGILAEKNYLNSLGIDADGMTLHDGSGLSRMNLVSPSQLVSMLRTMNRQTSIFPAFDSSLPVMGVDGSLSERLKGSRAVGIVHAKTGFLTGESCLSGYLRTKDDELFAFSFMMNNYTVPTREINDLQDQIVLALVNFSRK